MTKAWARVGTSLVIVQVAGAGKGLKGQKGAANTRGAPGRRVNLG